MSAAVKEYDWAWRKDEGPMTFKRLLYEAREICSPDLYLRWLTVLELIQGMHLCGLLDDFGKRPGEYRREHARRLQRLADHEFIRAYLIERRAGMPPRPGGMVFGVNECVVAVRRSVEAAAHAAHIAQDQAREREVDGRKLQRWRMFAAIWSAIGSLLEEDRRTS